MSKPIINIKFAADLKDFSSKMQNATRSIKNIGKQLTSVGTNLSVGVTAPFAAFSAVALSNFDKQSKAIAQLNAGLISTGRYTDDVSKKLQEQASALQENSLFGDEEILQKSTAQILSFTNIALDSIPRVNQVVADLSARLGNDLQSNAISVSKALNDPIANLSALSRQGIQFSEDQKKTIKALVETNKLAEAQGIILKELEAQYGGSAKAAADAGTGWLLQLKNQIGDLTEEFGVHISEALKPFGLAIKSAVSAIQSWSPETKKMALVIGGLGAALGPILVTLGLLMTSVVPGLITSFGYLRAALLATQTGFLKLTAVIAANPLGAIAVAIAAVTSYFVFFNKEVDNTIQKQNVLSEINDKATKSIANEKAKLEELLFIARNENIAKGARLKAIKQLNDISPKYLGDLTLEKINTDDARKAIELYNAELLKTAKLKAAQSKLQEVQKKIIDNELKAEQESIKSAKAYLKLKEEAVSQEDFLKLKVMERAMAEGRVKNLYDFRADALKGELDAILKIIAANQVLNTVKSTKPKGTGNKRKPASLLSDLGTRKGTVANVVEDNNSLVPRRQEGEQELTAFEQRLQQFNENSSAIMNDAAQGVAEGFGNMIASLASGNFSLKDVAGGLMSIIGDMAIRLGRAAIGIGIAMKSIKEAFKNPFTAIAAGIALIALGSIIKNSVSGITSGGNNSRSGFAGAFANGGIVGGSSYTGDKLFARVNSGEMILNQRQQSNLLGMLNPVAAPINIQLTGGVGIKDRELLMFIDDAKTKINRR